MAKKTRSDVSYRRRRADVDSKAARFVSDIMMGEDRVPMLAKVNAWLRKDPSHRAAFARYQAVVHMLRQ